VVKSVEVINNQDVRRHGEQGLWCLRGEEHWVGWERRGRTQSLPWDTPRILMQAAGSRSSYHTKIKVSHC
jgi:hypothetical protein